MRPLLLLLSTPILLLAGCGSGQSGKDAAASLPGTPESNSSFPLELVDASGDRVTLSAPPRRIISLVPSASQVLRALGAGDLLVGRTDYDTLPPLASLPSVGGGLNPNLEAVVALKPDLVIRFAGESDPGTPQRLDNLGIGHLAVRPDGLEDIRAAIRILGRVTERERAADSLLARMSESLEELRQRVEDLPPVRVAYLLGGNPPWVAGPGSYIHELLQLAGGINVFSDLEALYGPVNVEAFLVRDLDLFLAPEGTEITLPDPSVTLRRVSPELEIPGPNLARQAWALARALHPGAIR